MANGSSAPAPAPAVREEGVLASFVKGLDNRRDSIVSQLPRSITFDRFRSTAIEAVRSNPDILDATAQSIWGAIAKAAADGLMPDGREGVITVYSTKVKRKLPNSNAVEEVWEKRAQWNPMLFGIRKRARETDNIIIDAQAVYSGDHFLWKQGDSPAIEHIPPPLGQSRGELIGAYAIFRTANGEVLHREVMDATQIEAVRGQSKAGNSLMWTTFKEEAYRKVVIRRGIKTVPSSPQLDRVVSRDDETFEFNTHPAIEGVADAASLPPPQPKPTVVAIAGPPKAPPRAAVAQATGGSGAAPENAQRSLPARTDNAGQDSGGGAPAPDAQPKPVEPAQETGPAAPPPGVGLDGKVHMLGLFQEWVEQQVASATDASDLYDLWETKIEPWRERMPADWFKHLKFIQKKAIDRLAKPSADESESG